MRHQVIGSQAALATAFPMLHPLPALSVVVPCYNEEAGLDELHRRVAAACAAQVGSSYEIVLVNDGSADRTCAVMQGLVARDPHVVAVDLARNYGHQVALSAGLDHCRGERILILDADLQDPPELLGEMMARMDEGHDVVVGVRAKREGESLFKLATASIFYRLLSRLSDVEITANAGDFRLMSRRALDHLKAMPERYRFIRGMVSWIGLRQCNVEYVRNGRFAGSTHYPLRKMMLLAVDAITSFSVIPLRFASLIGFAFGLIGLFALAYTIFGWALGHTIPGWASLASLILILGSVQLLVLGIFGEYLGRMYMEAKQRPLYIVNEIHAAPHA
ncbi:MAG: glycosyltransferase family 2 protein [Allosphingosinicella sp.]